MNLEGSTDVIIPLYRGGAHIGETLRSALAQGDVVAEVVVVDDGSPDDSADVAREAAAGDPRVRVHRTVNMGQNAARNVGASLTRAPFLKFLDQDDILPQGALARQAEALASGRADVVVGAIARFSEEEQIAPLLEEIAGQELAGEVPQENLVAACQEIHPTFNEILIRRETFEATPGFNPRLGTCEEFDLTVRLYLALPDATTVYQPSPPALLKRCHDDSLGTQYRERSQADRNWAQVCYMELARTILDEGHEVTPLLKDCVFDRLYTFSTYAYRGGRRGYGLAGYEVWKEAGLRPPMLTPRYHDFLHRTLGFPRAEGLLRSVRACLRPRR